MTFDFFEILLLSAIQGISEFIPVSSSAHLFLVSDIYNFKIQSLLTDIGLHLGSLLAIITYFHSDLSNIFRNKNLLLLMIFGSAPVIIVGAILYQTNLISYLRNIEIKVDEKPTCEISAGAGVGTSGGNFAFNIRENNLLPITPTLQQTILKIWERNR